MKILPLLISALLQLGILCGCTPQQKEKTSEQSVQETWPSAADSIKADSILHTLSIEDKVGQMFMPAVYARDDAATLNTVRCHIADRVGGILILKGDASGAIAIHNLLVSRCRIAPWLAIDAEWGLGMRLDSLPVFPPNGAISGQADSRVMYTYGSEVAREGRALGINMVLGPVLDAPQGQKSAIGSRAFNGTPMRVAELGTSYAEGLERGGIMSIAKHFPGLGGISTDSHKELPTLNASLARLDSCHLQPFRIYVEAGLSGVMVGHLAVPAIDYEHRPAALSPIVISDLLRGDLQFRGLVLTDALNMGGNTEGDSGAISAIAAGADIILAPTNTKKAMGDVIAALQSGRLSQQRIDDACRRIILYKLRFAYPSAKEISRNEATRTLGSKAYVADTLKRALR